MAGYSGYARGGGKPVKVVKDDPNAPEMCAGCGEIFKKGEMHRTPDGLLHEECWKKSKWYNPEEEKQADQA